MIPINELKIGNYIDEQGLYLQVGMIQQGLFDASKPIPLTAEILCDWCGFKSDHPAYYYIFIEDDKFHVYYNNSGLHRYNVKYRYAYLKEIKYLHELQNLYFALTGKELTINIPKQ